MDVDPAQFEHRMWGTLGTCGFDERPLCLHCMAPLRPDAHFCKRCMAPVSSYASFGAFTQGNYEAIWSAGWIIWKAMTTPNPRRIHVLGVVLVFLPKVAGLLVFLPVLARGSEAGWFWPLLFWSVVGTIAIARTWQNYVERTQPTRNPYRG